MVATNSITLDAINLDIDADVDVDIAALTVDINGSALVDIDAGLITLNNGSNGAARVGDMVVAPPPSGIGTITLGSPTVLIGP